MNLKNNYQCDNQLSIFDIYSHDTLFGKTCAEPLAQTTEKILEPCLKKPVRWLTKTPMCLDLRKDRSGLTLDVSWVTDIALLGECMTHSSGVSHKEENAYVYSLTTEDTQPQKFYLNCSEKPMIPNPTKLSQILESNPDPKYRLSEKACQGILNRAMRRGKELPKLLQIALERQAATPSKLGGGVDIDSHGKRAGKGALVQTELSGTLGVSQDQTLITGECLNPWDVQSKHIQSENGVAESLYSGECRYGGGESYVMQSQSENSPLHLNPSVIGVDLYNQTATGDVAMSITGAATDPHHIPCVCFEPGSASRVGGHVYEDDVSGSLRANAGDNQQSVVCIEGNGVRESHKGDGYKESDTMYTLNTVEQHAVAYGVVAKGNGDAFLSEEKHTSLSTGGGEPGQGYPCVCYGISSYDSNAMKSPNPHSGVYEADTSRTLDLNGGSPACNQGGVAVVSYGLDRASFNQGKNAKFSFSVDEELAPSLVAKGPGGGISETVGSLCARDYKGVGNQYVDEGKCVIQRCRPSNTKN